jgi:hypothetical protein
MPQICSLGIGCTAISILPRFRTPAWRPFRALMFVGMGVSAVFPVFDGLRMFGLEKMEQQIGLSWMVLQGFLYIFGAGLYAVSTCAALQNRNTHCRLDQSTREALARTIRYLWQFASNFPYIDCPGRHFASQRTAPSLRLPPCRFRGALHVSLSQVHSLKSAFVNDRGCAKSGTVRVSRFTQGRP